MNTADSILSSYFKKDMRYANHLMTIKVRLPSNEIFERLLLKAESEGKRLDIDSTGLPEIYDEFGEENVILVTPEEWLKKGNWS